MSDYTNQAAVRAAAPGSQCPATAAANHRPAAWQVFAAQTASAGPASTSTSCPSSNSSSSSVSPEISRLAASAACRRVGAKWREGGGGAGEREAAN